MKITNIDNLATNFVCGGGWVGISFLNPKSKGGFYQISQLENYIATFLSLSLILIILKLRLQQISADKCARKNLFKDLLVYTKIRKLESQCSENKIFFESQPKLLLVILLFSDTYCHCKGLVCSTVASHSKYLIKRQLTNIKHNFVL